MNETNEFNTSNVAPATLTVDASEIAAYAKDLGPEALAALRPSREGVEEAATEIIANQALIGSQIGIPDKDIVELDAALQRIATIDAILPRARKQVEILEDTRAYLDDFIQRRISGIAAHIDTRIEKFGNRSLEGSYQKARTYRSAVAVKAARTRRKNALAATEPATPEPFQPDTQPTA